MGRRCPKAKKGRLKRSFHVPWRWNSFHRASSAAAYCARTVAAAAPAMLQELREQDRQHEDEQLTRDRPACKILLIGTMEEQDVEMVQIVMKKVISERIVHAVNPLAIPQSTKFAKNLVHKIRF